ncbi:MAG: tetratricopeptide repeat protein [Pseudomonadota bacterium]|nr:tetratricopeptide repeat protein [Pseudomonadota bacterium]
MHEYSQSDINRLFKLSPALLRSIARAGYTTPAAPEGKTTYSFQDLLILRTASALQAAKITPAKIVAALGHIRDALPPGSLLTTLALGAAGPDVVVREGTNIWEAKSGQYALPLEAGKATTVIALSKARRGQTQMMVAHQHYARGHALEESDVAAARAAYLDALNAHQDHLEARINLGRLLHLDGELKGAEKVYREAKSSSALLSFNLAILLEDLNREEEAISAYREALAQDPHLHDAHFNLSRLHERAKQPREALRHLLAYRRHVHR